MDTRIITLLVIISVAGSLADVHVPFYRVRRNGLQESDITAGSEFVETPRAKRQSIFESSSTAESTATPKPKDSATAPSTTPANASPKKPNPTSKPNPPNPARPTPGGSSTTPEQNPKTPAGKPTPPKADPTTSGPESTETTTEPTDSETPDEPKSTTPNVGLGSRIDAEEPAQAKKPQTKPNPAPSNSAASGYPQPPNSYVYPRLFAFPNFAPDYSRPYGQYDDPTFNSIPGLNNYAWTGSHNGQGAAASFASAGASSAGSPAGGFGGGASYGTKQPSLADRGAFVDNTPNTANSNSGYVPNFGYVPNAGYIPNMGSSGGFGYSGVGTPFQDPSAFAFPSPDNFQRQMDEYFRQWQNQFQKQQQQIFETANRIGTDGYAGPPGSNSAVSSISLGPQGGYQAGAINPVAPGLQSRFSEDIAPPSGNSYGVFSSSSSKTVIGPDGKPVSHKTSTTGVNDNGKITFRTVED